MSIKTLKSWIQYSLQYVYMNSVSFHFLTLGSCYIFRVYHILKQCKNCLLLFFVLILCLYICLPSMFFFLIECHIWSHPLVYNQSTSFWASPDSHFTCFHFPEMTVPHQSFCSVISTTAFFISIKYLLYYPWFSIFNFLANLFGKRGVRTLGCSIPIDSNLFWCIFVVQFVIVIALCS